MTQKDILCIGHITHDRIITPSTPEGVDCAGGTVFYAAWAASALQTPVSYGVVTSTAADLDHEVERLRSAGIPVDNHASPASVFFENSYGHGLDNRSQRVLSKAAPFTIDALSDFQADVFHLGTLLQDDFPPEVVEFLSKKGKVALDVQGYLREVRGQEVHPCQWPDKERVLAATHTVKLNEEEAATLTGITDLHAAASTIASWGPREVLLTLGSRGSLIFADGTFTTIPPCKPPHVLDSTGCGDTFTAVYLLARHHGASVATSGRLAAAASALKLAYVGPLHDSLEAVMKLSGITSNPFTA